MWLVQRPLIICGSIRGNNINEGGEIQLVGAGTNGTVQLDNFIGHIRVHTLAAGKQFQVLGGSVYADGTTAANYFAGNVGIGTPGPGAKLHVVSTAVAPSPNFLVTNGLKTVGFYEAGGGSFNPTTGAHQALAFSNDSDPAVSTGGLSIVPWSTTAGGVQIMENGNVGIGVTAPTTKLQVAGVISPSAPSAYSLGEASLGFTVVYADNGVIQTSDARQKKDILPSDLGLDFINKLRNAYSQRLGRNGNEAVVLTCLVCAVADKPKDDRNDRTNAGFINPAYNYFSVPA